MDQKTKNTITMVGSVAVAVLLFLTAPPLAVAAMVLGGIWVLHNDLQEIIRRLPPPGQ